MKLDELKICNESTIYTDEQLKKIEDHYSAKYVFESCIKDKKGNWINQPAAIFYQEEAHPRGSNYFAVYNDYLGNTYIADGISAVHGSINGVVTKDGRVLYSRFRHDYRGDGDVFVDGGRDYFRHNAEKTAKMAVYNEKLKVINVY